MLAGRDGEAGQGLATAHGEDTSGATPRTQEGRAQSHGGPRHGRRGSPREREGVRSPQAEAGEKDAAQSGISTGVNKGLQSGPGERTEAR